MLADGNVCLSISSDVAWRELLALVPSLSGSYSIKRYACFFKLLSFPVVLKVSPLVRTAIKAIKCVLLGIFGEGIFDSDSRSFIYGFISRLYRKHSWCNLQTLTLNFYMRLSKVGKPETLRVDLIGRHDHFIFEGHLRCSIGKAPTDLYAPYRFGAARYIYRGRFNYCRGHFGLH